MAAPIKPSIVFCHGLWADGSCFSKVMPALQADGHEVIAAQYGLDAYEEDVATIKRTLGRVKSPAILVPLHRGFDGLKFNGGLGGPRARPKSQCCARRPRSA